MDYRISNFYLHFQFSQNTDKLKQKLKNLQTNKAALTNLGNVITTAVQSRRYVYCYTTCSNYYNIRSEATSSVSCTIFTTTSQTILTMVSQNPVSYSIFSLIQTLLSINVVCTDDEKVTLAAISASVEDAIGKLEDEEAHIQSTHTCKL